MVGSDGLLPLPWIEPALRRAFEAQNAHALLLHGPHGVGQFELALTLAQAWLCEQRADARSVPCGACPGCKLVLAHSHPDLLVLLPANLQESLRWGAVDTDEPAAERSSKTAKPSKEIKVEAVRAAVVFTQTTSARGRGKVVVVHPAERMNAISSNTLLKTLEEPPGDARFILTSAAPDALLPTIRSRCLAVALGLPGVSMAVAWLEGQGVAGAATLLAATGGQPQEALEWSGEGIDAAFWSRLPAMVRRGEAAALLAWPLPRLVDALQKVCHDAVCASIGTPCRYFPLGSVLPGADARALEVWRLELQRVARHAEHPWNGALLVESLVQQGSRALAGSNPGAPPARTGSVHSRA